jgi:hypothetical protein
MRDAPTPGPIPDHTSATRPHEYQQSADRRGAPADGEEGGCRRYAWRRVRVRLLRLFRLLSFFWSFFFWRFIRVFVSRVFAFWVFWVFWAFGRVFRVGGAVWRGVQVCGFQVCGGLADKGCEGCGLEVCGFQVRVRGF